MKWSKDTLILITRLGAVQDKKKEINNMCPLVQAEIGSQKFAGVSRSVKEALVSWLHGDNRDDPTLADIHNTLPDFSSYSIPRVGRKGGGVFAVAAQRI